MSSLPTEFLSRTGYAPVRATVSPDLTGPITSVGNATSISNSVNLPGSPTTTTQAGGTNNTTIATTAFVTAAVSSGTVTLAGENYLSILAGVITAHPINLSGSNVTSILTLAKGGTGADLSGTGGASQVLRQSTLGGVVTVGQLSASDLTNGTTGSGALVLATAATTNNLIVGTQSPGDNSTKAASTAYVDAAILGQDFKIAAKYATTAPLPAVIYANGSSGVGATLTGVAFGALGVDSASPSVADRILVKNQVSTLQNGIYTVTATGSGIAVFVLTRTTDANQSVEINQGDSLFVVSGTTQTATTWAINSGSNPIIGTDPITFAQTAGVGSFTAGNGISITGTSIAIDTAVTVDKTTAQILTNKTLTAPIMTAPVLGTPTSGVLTNCTGTASGLTAGTVTTNANLTGVITSVGNVTSIASQTGTGTKFVVDTSPILITPNLNELSSTNPSTPTTGSTVFSRKRAGVNTPAFLNGTNPAADLQHSFYQKRISWVYAQGNNNSGLLYTNQPVYATTGLASVSMNATGSLLASVPHVEMNTSSSANSFSTLYPNVKGTIQRGSSTGLGGFLKVYRFGIDGAQTGMGWFVGICDQSNGFNPIGNNDVTFAALGGTAFFGVGCDAGDTNVHFICMGSSARTYTDLGSSFPSATTGVFYELRIWCKANDTLLYYSFERFDSAQFTEGSSNTNIPANNIYLNDVINFRNAATAAVVSGALCWIYTETDF